MSILGIGMDYGPFMFLDNYDPWATGNQSDVDGRYRFERQPEVMLWNLSKLGRTLVELVAMNDEGTHPLTDAETNVQIVLEGSNIISQLLTTFEPIFIEKYTELMSKVSRFILSLVLFISISLSRNWAFTKLERMIWKY
jgi:serine/tyrosine/threonine adenylyltransferase